MSHDADLRARFLETLNASERTRNAYSYDLEKFALWCERSGLTIQSLTQLDVEAYAQACRSTRLAKSTIRRRLQTLAMFFGWLYRTQNRSAHLDFSELIEPPLRRTALRDTPSVTELNAMWRATKNDRERGVFALLTFNSMTIEEICGLNVEDLSAQDNVPLLKLHSRTRHGGYGLAILSAPAHTAITAHIGKRRSGPLFLGQQGDRLSGRTVIRITRSLGERADIDFRVKPLSLTYSLRSAAIEHGFSYLGVMRAVGSRDHRRHIAVMQAASNPITENASLRFSRLVLAGEPSAFDQLQQAESILNDTDAPPAAALAFVGAVLESHLRTMTTRADLRVDRSAEKATIGTYLQVLRGANIINNAEHKLLQSIAHQRDNAAHGWFDRISTNDFYRVLSQIKHFISDHPERV